MCALDRTSLRHHRGAEEIAAWKDSSQLGRLFGLRDCDSENFNNCAALSPTALATTQAYDGAKTVPYAGEHCDGEQWSAPNLYGEMRRMPIRAHARIRWV